MCQVLGHFSNSQDIQGLSDPINQRGNWVLGVAVLTGETMTWPRLGLEAWVGRPQHEMKTKSWSWTPLLREWSQTAAGGGVRPGVLFGPASGVGEGEGSRWETAGARETWLFPRLCRKGASGGGGGYHYWIKCLCTYPHARSHFGLPVPTGTIVISLLMEKTDVLGEVQTCPRSQS